MAGIGAVGGDRVSSALSKLPPPGGDEVWGHKGVSWALCYSVYSSTDDDDDGQPSYTLVRLRASRTDIFLSAHTILSRMTTRTP
jgi:hypothetical protein